MFLNIFQMIIGLPFIVSLIIAGSFANPIEQTKGKFVDKFRQFEGEDWPTPNRERPATGAPGSEYWQQEVDYTIQVELDEKNKMLTGKQHVFYTNHSPFEINMLWISLEKNRYRADSMSNLSRSKQEEALSYYEVREAVHYKKWDGSYRMESVQDMKGKDLSYHIHDTLMRIDLDSPIKPGESYAFKLNWKHNIRNAKIVGGRGGYECFNRIENLKTAPKKDQKNDEGNCIYEIAQWYPRMVAYSDYEGWHNKAFLGRGEFTLEFGDFKVEITVPLDFIIASTGVLQNPDEVLSKKQRERLKKAEDSTENPVFITTPKEALKNEKQGEKSKKTWIFKAENVRDFSWAGSRKFIWDAMAVKQPEGENRTVLAMSFYPNEAEPLWSSYSTKAIAHTIHVYSKYSIPYPYPIAQSVNGPVGGMEYPMITFNGPRPVIDESGNRTYSRSTKRGLISVIIHEIGHIYFPMTINSDERQWTWMDEGLNTFLQYQAEQEWEENYLSRRGIPAKITDYMRSDYQVPIMTNSESILQFGNNAYGKPATALSILRESILGRELFDKAFKTYSERWRFKRPTPYDFFRTMEEVSGVDLDWFWRGWFYSTDHVDIGIDSVVEGKLSSLDPEIEMEYLKKQEGQYKYEMTFQRNKRSGIITYAKKDPSLKDFYSKHDQYTPSKRDKEAYQAILSDLKNWETEILKDKHYFYFVSLDNLGGLVMPVILKVTYVDGSYDVFRYPAEIWRRNPDHIIKLVMTEKQASSFQLDPFFELADTYLENNYFPQRILPSRIELYKNKYKRRNLMKDMDLTVKSEDGLKTFDQKEMDQKKDSKSQKEAMDSKPKDKKDKKIFIWDLFKKRD